MSAGQGMALAILLAIIVLELHAVLARLREIADALRERNKLAAHAERIAEVNRVVLPPMAAR